MLQGLYYHKACTAMNPFFLNEIDLQHFDDIFLLISQSNLYLILRWTGVCLTYAKS